mmetsp:Transcript_4500/g.18326  ORF Transcript_4500/g.18326 Transcript_4500/m.18326 type:complete len:109 (+) Transcript_4500:80-406(+)
MDGEWHGGAGRQRDQSVSRSAAQPLTQTKGDARRWRTGNFRLAWYNTQLASVGGCLHQWCSHLTTPPPQWKRQDLDDDDDDDKSPVPTTTAGPDRASHHHHPRAAGPL